MKLLIVIVNYKVTDLTIDCLRSLSSEIHQVPGTRVAVCENGTGEEAVEAIRQVIDSEGWSDWISLEAVSPNRGFTGGNNVILEPALRSDDPPDYTLLLNADTLVRPGAVKALVDFMDQNPAVGIAGSRLEDPDGTPQVSAFRFHHFLGEFDIAIRLRVVSRVLKRWKTYRNISDVPCKIDWLAGASMIIRRDVFEAIGVLDEDYYTYYDDLDFCLNAHRAGWPTWYVPTSRVVHLVGRTTGVTERGQAKRRPPYWFQARRHFFLKNHGPLGALLADSAHLAGLTLWQIRRWILRRPNTDPEKFLRDSFRHSVFLTGFRVKPVRNPLMPQSGGR